MNINFYDEKANKKSLELEDVLIELKKDSNPDLLAQCVRVYATNARQGTLSVKTRAEVSGGGKKPWRQKGTGRARHGSTRSPIWVGGGRSHGPVNRVWSLTLNKKQKKTAFKTVLKDKIINDLFSVFDFAVKNPSTKQFNNYFSKINNANNKTLVLTDKESNILNSVKNIANVQTEDLMTVNVMHLLKNKNVLLTKKAFEKLKEKLK